jgi:thiol:disulfide interchange protein DsbA
MNINTFSSQTIKSIFMLAIATSLFACQGESSAQTPLSDSNYTLLNAPLGISSGDKIEVAELFWYGCGHCFSLEPQVNAWKKDIPDNVAFVKVPAIFSKRWEFHGKAFYTMEALGVLEEANDAFFHRIHVEKKPVNDLDALVKFMADYGKTANDVTSAFNSFAIDTKLRNAKTITAKSTATGVPAFLVDGKYHTSVSLAGSTTNLFNVIDQLIVKATAAR